MATKAITPPKKARRPAKLIHRGVEILRPAAPPITPLERIRRAARIAVKKHAHEFISAE